MIKRNTFRCIFFYQNAIRSFCFKTKRTKRAQCTRFDATRHGEQQKRKREKVKKTRAPPIVSSRIAGVGESAVTCRNPSS